MMTQLKITCPHCGQEIIFDQTTAARVLSQVRDQAMSQEVQRQVEAFKTQNANEMEAKTHAAVAEAVNAWQQKVAELEQHVAVLTSNLKQAQSNTATEIQLAISNKEKEFVQKQNDLQNQLNNKDLVIDELNRSWEKRVEEAEHKRAGLGTKMLGESLEQYCYREFQNLQSQGLYPDVVFEKDNIVSKRGQKADFLLRATDPNTGVEYLSITFEMKNEQDATKNKTKNSDHFDKLNKDRNDNNCTYAVLVSMLERDNDFYNVAFRDVSHMSQFGAGPNMFVVRPEHFLDIISLLYKASRQRLQELNLVVSENNRLKAADEDLTRFKGNFDRSVEQLKGHAGRVVSRHEEAIKAIDDAIADLQNVKKKLEGSSYSYERIEKHIVNNMDLKALTKGAPSIRKRLEPPEQTIEKEAIDGEKLSEEEEEQN